MEKSWDVIFWTTQKAVNYVPSSWANREMTAYKWPTGVSHPGQTSIDDVIAKCEDLDKDFKFFPAKFKKRVTSIADAEKYASRGEKQSDIESIIDGAVSDSGSSYSQLSKRSFGYLEEAIGESSDDEINANRWKRQRPEFTPLSDVGSVLSRTSQILNNQSMLDLENLELTGHSTTTAIVDNTPQASGSVDSEQSIPLLSESEKYLVKVISGLVYEVKDLKKQVHSLENRIILNNRSSSIDAGFDANRGISSEIMNMVPASTTIDLEKLESTISNSEEAYTLLIDILYLVGGTDYKESIYACMKKTLNADVANGYSTYGKLRGGKRKASFSSLKLCEALKEAIRRRFPAMTDMEFMERVGTFLCTAKDREGDRKTR